MFKDNETVILSDVVNGNPVFTGNFHADFFAIMGGAISVIVSDSSCRLKSDNVLLISFSNAGHYLWTSIPQ